MALEGVIAQCYPIALLLVPHTSRKKNYKNDFLYYCAIGYAMTAFEQAWLLLKSNQLKDEEYWYNKIQEEYGEEGKYSDMAPKPSLREIAEEVGFGPIGGEYRKPRQGELLKPITPLEERVADRPPVSHIEWNPNQNKYTLRGTGDEELSTLKPGMPMGESAFPEGDMPLMDILGETPRKFGRKGYYQKLLRGLLNAGIDILSDSRNPESNPFHQKFIQNLPPNLEAVYRPNSEGKINFITPINYRRKPLSKPTSELYEALGKTKRMRAKNRPEINIAMSDLARRDYGALPIRNIPLENVREPIASRQTQLDEFSPPPPPTPPVEWDKLRQTMPWGKEKE